MGRKGKGEKGGKSREEGMRRKARDWKGTVDNNARLTVRAVMDLILSRNTKQAKHCLPTGGKIRSKNRI